MTMRRSDGETERREKKIAPSLRRTLASSLTCAACGAEARRETASFCLVCGKSLDEDYQPLDTLRASYRLQGKSVSIENTEDTSVGGMAQIVGLYRVGNSRLFGIVKIAS